MSSKVTPDFSRGKTSHISNLSPFSLAGKTALVTGGGSGIGAAAAMAFAEAGAGVILAGRNVEKLKTVEKEIRRRHNPPLVLSLRCDVAKPAEVRRVAKKILDKYTVDILVNAAGIVARYSAETLPEKEWDAVIDTNLKGTFLLSQLFGAPMLARGGGKIINVASMLSFTGGMNASAYSASKGGVAQLTKSLANEWAARGVNVNAIAPGYIHTFATSGLMNDKRRYAAIRDRIPAGRWGEPDDVKWAFVFLASKAADYVHGHVLCVDGGYLAR